MSESISQESAQINVRKSCGSVEPYDRKKLLSIIKKVYSRAGITYSSEVGKEIVDSLFVYDGIMCSSIRSQIESRLEERDARLKAEYISWKDKEIEDEHFVTAKKKFIENYKRSSNTANATVDDNSNVGCKNIGVLNAEIHKEDNIKTTRAMIMDKLKELYPDFNAKNYIKDLNNHIIYKHDESSFAIPAPYCVSITMYPFLTDGIKKLGGLSARPMNLDSYCGIYCNLIFNISSQFAGAVASGEFLLYFVYFCKKEWGEDFWKRSNEVVSRSKSKEKTILSEIHQKWQQVIYTLSQPAGSRNGQSPFVNFSYFDKPFFEGMFGNFYFPDGSQPDWESLCWAQKEFMKWFNAERLRCVLTFPVESVTLIYRNGKFEDEDMYNFVCEEYARGHSFFTYISDTVDSLSSCCFDGTEIIEFEKDGIEMKMPMKEFIERYGDNKYEGNVIDNIYINSYDNEGNQKGKTRIVGYLNKEYSDYLYEFNIDGRFIKVTPDHLILVKDVHSGDIMSVPAQYVYNNLDKYLIAIEGE